MSQFYRKGVKIWLFVQDIEYLFVMSLKKGISYKEKSLIAQNYVILRKITIKIEKKVEQIC